MNTWRFALILGAVITLAGLGLDLALGGRGFPAPGWPDNAILLLAFLFFQFAVWWVLRGTLVMEGLGGTRLGVTALGLLVFWGIFLGSFPQVVPGEEAILFQRITRAPPFILAVLLLLANLGWAILRQLSSGWSAKSLFLFNHTGVYVVGAAALFGSGDVIRLDIWVREGQMAWTGTDRSERYEMPFAIALDRFERNFFPPQLTLIDGESGEILLPRGEDMLTLRQGKSAKFQGLRVEVLELTMEAPWSVPRDPIPAAFLRVEDASGKSQEGWVSCGNTLMPPIFLAIGSKALAMPEPRSRSYASHFDLVLPDQEDASSHSLMVNQPVRVAGWWLYQKGYSVEGGPEARFSQIEAVRDPWLPGVYSGIFLMGVGAVLAIGRAGTLLKEWKRSYPDLAPNAAERNSDLREKAERS